MWGVLNAAQLCLGSVQLWGPLKYLIAIAATTFIGLVTYQWLVRYTFIGFLSAWLQETAVAVYKIFVNSIEIFARTSDLRNFTLSIIPAYYNLPELLAVLLRKAVPVQGWRKM